MDVLWMAQNSENRLDDGPKGRQRRNWPFLYFVHTELYETGNFLCDITNSA